MTNIKRVLYGGDKYLKRVGNENVQTRTLRRGIEVNAFSVEKHEPYNVLHTFIYIKCKSRLNNRDSYCSR